MNEDEYSGSDKVRQSDNFVGSGFGGSLFPCDKQILQITQEQFLVQIAKKLIRNASVVSQFPTWRLQCR